MTYTILQPTFFMEVWLSPALGFDAAQGDSADLRIGATQDQLDFFPGRRRVCNCIAR